MEFEWDSEKAASNALSMRFPFSTTLRARLDSIKEEDIDFSDIPPQTGLKGWSRPGLFGGAQGAARRGAVLKEKLLVLDDDVVRLFEENGEISPEKLNAVLREYAETHRNNACEADGVGTCSDRWI